MSNTFLCDFLGIPCGSAGKESTCNVGDLGLIPGKIPWRWKRLSTLVFWPRKFHGLYSPLGCKESDRTERLSLFTILKIQKFLCIVCYYYTKFIQKEIYDQRLNHLLKIA